MSKGKVGHDLERSSGSSDRRLRQLGPPMPPPHTPPPATRVSTFLNQAERLLAEARPLEQGDKDLCHHLLDIDRRALEVYSLLEFIFH